ncbi:hypothetical protein GGR58DRAFT_498587 [Xylaria digitata]|nr:hypothetical protein GGR58DRAFT_498587 [Xylaria digitata]
MDPGIISVRLQEVRDAENNAASPLKDHDILDSGSTKRTCEASETLTKMISHRSRGRELAEAAWNEYVHGPMLDLVVLHTPNVAVENVTRTNIVEEFIPLFAATCDAQFNGKTIDYALVLRLEPGLNERLLDFVSHLDPPSFNQTNYPPLRTWPTGIFVKTKAKEHG